MDQIPTHILLQMQQEQERDQMPGNDSEIKQIENNLLLNDDVMVSKGILSDGETNTDKSNSDDEDDDDKDGKGEGEEGRTEEEIEADFVSWFGSLKDEEAVRPKEEAVQVRRLLQTLPFCAVLYCTVLSNA